jgi:hypothetical protein
MQNEHPRRTELVDPFPFAPTDASSAIPRERRKRPTPGLSRYTLFGRRRGFCRERNHGKEGYVDRYSTKLFIAMVAILGLNVLDVILTMVILEHRGFELNPMVRSAIEVYGDSFWLWKYGIVSACLVLLCLHIKYKRVKTIILATCYIYVAIVLYQVYIITFQLPAAF